MCDVMTNSSLKVPTALFRPLIVDKARCPGAGIVTQLCWSSNSELLAVVLSQATPAAPQAPHTTPQAPSETPQSTAAVVQIWHRSNWHWYLKHKQLYPDEPAVTVVWDEVVPLRMHICSGGWYRQVCKRLS